ncbi:MAG: apolipoprotein N-acyltransferase [Serpentinimonas sp.]|nr:apolipoprotein N-acyltransferase [Serpentinimonas sp.]
MMRGAWSLALLLAGFVQALALAWPFQTLALAGFGLHAGEPTPLLQWLALGVLVLAIARAPSWRRAAWRTWLFALAWLCGSFWWLFVSMNTYGGMAGPLAAAAVGLLAAFLALYYAAAGALFWRWRDAAPLVQALSFAALWTLAEVARGTLLTGFPWGAIGYAHVDSMAALAPWVGVYGMGALAAALAAGTVAALLPSASAPRSMRRAAVSMMGARSLISGRLAWPVALLLALWLPLLLWPQHLGNWLAQRAPTWTVGTGELPVVLLQGNIAQDKKFEPHVGIPFALQWYKEQTALALDRLDAAGQSGLVVLPETAIPLLPQEIEPLWWDAFLGRIKRSQSAVMIGIPVGNWMEGYTNSVLGWTPTLQPYRYDKYHLVPFGEFVPPFFQWFIDKMQIPLGAYRPGTLGQAPMEWAGQRLGPNICYEDLFGEELAAAFRLAHLAPTVLVNVSNIGWFGDTVAIDQHRQIARLRALELQRPMVRATNTGSTVGIDHMGRVLAELPRLTRGALDLRVEGRSGLTPFARWAAHWALWPLVGLAALVLALCWRRTSGAKP